MSMLKLAHIIAAAGISLMMPVSVFGADLFIHPDGGLYFSRPTPLAGERVRIYATVSSNSSEDVRAQVRFFAGATQIGATQPITVLANRASTVFVDWYPQEGYYNVAVSIANTDPNSVQPETEDFVLPEFLVDLDTDGDGIYNTKDLDDDGDGIDDGVELIHGTNPMNPDTDGDGVNDGQDAFPTDPARWAHPVPSAPEPEASDDADSAPSPAVLASTSQSPSLAQSNTTQQEEQPEYAIEEVEYTFPDAPEAAYELDVVIAKSKVSWNTYQFEALGAEDSYLYVWDFGDQTYSQSQSPEHKFPGSGEYEIKVSVSDGAGGLGTATERVSIGFWNMAHIPVIIMTVLLGAFGAFLAGYLVYSRFFSRTLPVRASAKKASNT
ncbi:MAG: PKD domain-containing protein [bacterium]|nr:PKD domain-containing protein [bacterium]